VLGGRAGTRTIVGSHSQGGGNQLVRNHTVEGHEVAAGARQESGYYKFAHCRSPNGPGGTDLADQCAEAVAAGEPPAGPSGRAPDAPGRKEASRGPARGQLCRRWVGLVCDCSSVTAGLGRCRTESVRRGQECSVFNLTERPGRQIGPSFSFAAQQVRLPTPLFLASLSAIGRQPS
jgi:hypothetical protein